MPLPDVALIAERLALISQRPRPIVTRAPSADVRESCRWQGARLAFLMQRDPAASEALVQRIGVDRWQALLIGSRQMEPHEVDACAAHFAVPAHWLRTGDGAGPPFVSDTPWTDDATWSSLPLALRRRFSAQRRAFCDGLVAHRQADRQGERAQRHAERRQVERARIERERQERAERWRAIGQRIQTAIFASDISVADVARRAGLDPVRAAAILRLGQDPERLIQPTVAQTGMPVHWVRTGEGDQVFCQRMAKASEESLACGDVASQIDVRREHVRGRIRQLMELGGYTPAVLARRVDIAAERIVGWRSSGSVHPRLALRAMAWFGLPVSWLWSDDPVPGDVARRLADERPAVIAEVEALQANVRSLAAEALRAKHGRRRSQATQDLGPMTERLRSAVAASALSRARIAELVGMSETNLGLILDLDIHSLPRWKAKLEQVLGVDLGT